MSAWLKLMSGYNGFTSIFLVGCASEIVYAIMRKQVNERETTNLVAAVAEEEEEGEEEEEEEREFAELNGADESFYVLCPHGHITNADWLKSPDLGNFRGCRFFIIIFKKRAEI